MPEAASEKFVLLTDQPGEAELAIDHAPAAVPLVVLAVSAPPVGAVVSEAKETDDVPVLPAPSVPVTVYVAGLDGLAVQEKLEDAYVIGLLPEPDDTVSARWVQPVVLISGKVAEAAPDAASVTAALKMVDEARSPR